MAAVVVSRSSLYSVPTSEPSPSATIDAAVSTVPSYGNSVATGPNTSRWWNDALPSFAAPSVACNRIGSRK